MHRLQEVFGLQGEFASSSELAAYLVLYQRGFSIYVYLFGMYSADRPLERQD